MVWGEDSQEEEEFSRVSSWEDLVTMTELKSGDLECQVERFHLWGKAEDVGRRGTGPELGQDCSAGSRAAWLVCRCGPHDLSSGGAVVRWRFLEGPGSLRRVFGSWAGSFISLKSSPSLLSFQPSISLQRLQWASILQTLDGFLFEGLGLYLSWLLSEPFSQVSFSAAEYIFSPVLPLPAFPTGGVRCLPSRIVILTFPCR